MDIMPTINNIVFYTAFAVFLLTLLAVLFAVEILLLIPLKRLIKDVGVIRTSKDFSLRVHSQAQGELALLSDSINQLLDTLQDSETKIKRTNESLTKQSSEVLLKSQELERMNQYMVGREVRMTELKKQIEDLKTQLSNIERNK